MTAAVTETCSLNCNLTKRSTIGRDYQCAMPWGRPKVTGWRPAEALSAVQSAVQCRDQCSAECSAEISAGLERLLEVGTHHVSVSTRLRSVVDTLGSGLAYILHLSE